MDHRPHPSLQPGLNRLSDLPNGRHRVRQAITVFRQLYESAAFYTVLLIFAVFSLSWSLPAALLYPLLPHRMGIPLGQFMINAGFRFYVAVLKGSGLLICDMGALDVLNGETGIMVVANHPTALDAVLIISRQSRITCIMKAVIWDNIFLGGGARLAGYIRNNAPHSMLKQTVEALRNGQKILVFPEGTRTRRDPIGDFTGGFAIAAKKAGAPVQTVIIETNLPDFDKHWFLFRRPAAPVVFRLRLGRRFDVAGDVQTFVRDLHDYFHGELKPASPSRPKAPRPSL